MSREDGRALPEIIVPPPGPRSVALAARLAATECPAFEARRDSRSRASGEEQAPIVYARGLGANVWDEDGNRYVDLVCGFGALALGHAPRAVLEPARAQMDALTLALGDVFATEVKVALCERLARLLPEPGVRVMLGLSGADAVTAALKTAVLATGKPGVVAFEGGYHGLSYAPLAACGLAAAFREPFRAQLGDHVTFVPYPRAEDDLDATLARVRAAIASNAGAVVVEPVLGRGGVVLPHPRLLSSLREACDAGGALLVADEVWTGLGRSGAWLATLDAGVTPDLVCLGKALGAGFPVSACVGRAAAMRAWGAHGGTTIHTATHFGWPVGCRAALASLDALEQEGLPERARIVGARWVAELARVARVKAARGRGLMVGVELADGATALATARRLLARGWIVVTGGVNGATLTLTPPLDVDEALLEAFVPALEQSL